MPFLVWGIMELLAIILVTVQIAFKALYTNRNLTLRMTTNFAGFHTTWLQPIQGTAKGESEHRHQ
jgi:hypothetical protein